MSTFTELVEQLNEALCNAEDVFADRFRVRAEIELPDERGLLTYTKQNKHYGFVVVKGDTLTPVLKLSITMRVLCAQQLPRLWEACEASDVSSQQAVADATMAINDFIATVKKV